MIQSFASYPGGFYKYLQVFDQLWLTRKFADVCRPDIIFEFLFCRCQMLLITIQVGICHELFYLIIVKLIILVKRTGGHSNVMVNYLTNWYCRDYEKLDFFRSITFIKLFYF